MLDIVYEDKFYIIYRIVLLLIFAYMEISSIWLTRPQELKALKEWGKSGLVLIISFLFSFGYSVEILLGLNRILFFSDLFRHINFALEAVYLAIPLTYAGLMVIAIKRKGGRYPYTNREIFILILCSICFSRLLLITANTAVKKAYLSPVALGMTGIGLMILFLYFF